MFSAEQKVCQNCKASFTIDASDFLFYEKINVPPPTWCPQCRRVRRYTWRNDFTFYSRACGMCKRPIVSLYHPDSPRIVYCNKCWWSDSWDPKEYATAIDFSRPFFEQVAELQARVPALALVNDDGIASVNCQYTQDFAFGKNCYMCFVGWFVENALYGLYSAQAKDFVDCITVFQNSQYIYDSIWVAGSYRCRNVEQAYALTNCMFCYDCRDSSDCFMCAGLRHKKYCYRNEQYSKEEYEKILTGYRLDTWKGQEQARREFKEFKQHVPRRFAATKQCTNATGDFLSNCKNVSWAFNSGDAEDSKFIENCDTPKDCYDLLVGGKCSQCCESITPDESYRNVYGIYSWKSTEIAYCDSCHSSKYLFGCVGLKKSEYCILNKAYSKEEYEMLRARLVAHMTETGEWGEFFPSRLSPFGYNESVAALYAPLEKNAAVGRGFSWRDETQMTKGKETLAADKIPDSIRDVTDALVNEVLACISCGRNYRIIAQELGFYKTMGIPIPRECFQCRLAKRWKLRNPYQLWHRTCTCGDPKSGNGVYTNQTSHFHGAAPCSNEFETSYAPERPEIVYCEECYNSEIG